MYVLIAGGGRTGSTLALTLHEQKHEVRLLEHRPQVLAHIHRDLPTEIIYEGNATDPRTLELAGIENAQVLVASMSNDAENLSLCFIARERFKVPRTIATINDPRNAWLFDRKFHVDVALNQADILAGLIEQEMSLGDMMTLLKLRKGAYSLVSETLPPGARAVGQSIQELPLPRASVICAILRKGEVVIPRGNVRLEEGDDVLALVDDHSAPELAALFGPPAVAGTPPAAARS
jgi:trk system potassium uptake protein